MKWKWWLFYVFVGAASISWYAGYFTHVPTWVDLFAFGLLLVYAAVLYRDQRRVRNERFQQRAARLESAMWEDARRTGVRGAPVDDRDVAS